MRKIKDKKAQKDIRELLEEEKTDEMLEYIRIYADSVESPDKNDKRSKKARELLQYLGNNRQGLLPYDRQGVAIPEPPEGLVYKHMGVQFWFSCTPICLYKSPSGGSGIATPCLA